MSKHVADSPMAGAGAAAAAHLEAYLPGDRKHALATGRPIPDRVTGAALFADISGFTPLTEMLSEQLGPQRGAEELTANLNRLFEALVTDLERFGGHVIYFSGDAITCWLDGDDGARATACALAMQATMSEVGEVVTPSGVRVRIALKAAVAVGAARRFVVGDPDIQLMDILAGQLVDALSAAEQLANRNEVVLHPSTLQSLGDRADIREFRIDPASGRKFGVVAALTRPVAAAPSTHFDGALSADALRRWVLPAVFERLRTGRAEFLAELRRAFPIFVHFGGTDYDIDDDAMQKLDVIVRLAQRVLTSFGGNVLQLTLGDKGGYLYGVLGAPLAHEDDAARAASAVLELRDALGAATDATAIQIGVTTGRLLSGTYGHRRRQVFSCLGDAVNLAARLMTKAPPGHIYVSAPVRRLAGDAFTWDELAPITVKGKAEPVSAFSLTGSKRRPAPQRASDALPLIGRTKELGQLNEALDAALTARGRIVGISAEAGMGKSRLIAEFARAAEQRGVVTAMGECQSYGTNTRYFAWREVWSKLFGFNDSMSDDERIRALHAALVAIDPELFERAPLLAALLDLPLPENDLTALLDAKVRKSSLESLLAECLRAKAAEGPVLIVLEDCHWLDTLSRDLVSVLARRLVDLDVMLVLAYRPITDAGETLGVETLPHFSEMALVELDAEQSAQLIRTKVEQLLGTDARPLAALVDLITKRAQGNPFYIEELLSFIRDRGVDLQNESALARLELPDSLHNLLLSRIDTLAEAPRRTLKVASIVGRVFRAPMLPGVYPDLGSIDEVRDHLRTLDASGLVNIDQEGEETYLFKHAFTQEVTYESMPFAFRSVVHERVGHYIEDVQPEAVDRHLDLLAHHYWHSGNLPKKREYLGRAGDAAQASYANPAAIDYFERLAPLLEGSARIDALLKLGQVVERVGDWHRAEQVEKEALLLAETVDDVHWRATSETALAEVARKQTRYDESFELLARAQRRFESLREEAGVAKVLHLMGTLAAQRGDYDKAVDSYEASLRIRERTGDKAGMGSLLSNLGVVAEYRGDYAGSRALHERALALRSEIGDRWGIAVSTGNLGMIALLQKEYAAAWDLFQKAIQLAREIGDPWMVALSHNNLGNATRGLGQYDAARSHYAESLRIYRNYDDRWSLAFLFEDVATLAALDNDPRAALALIGAATAARETIGAPRAPSQEEEIEARIGPSVAALSEAEQADWRARGRGLDLAAAVDYALGVCEGARAIAA